MCDSNPFQRTSEWFEARCGCLTASRARAVIARKKNGEPYAEYGTVLEQIVGERLTGVVSSTGTTAAMQWGIDHEEEARDQYVIETGRDVALTGFIEHPVVKWLGASPDGLVGDDGLVEIKCPTTLAHIKRVAAGVVPEEYKPQMLVQLLCTGRKWVDFVDYDPRLSSDWEKARFFCVRYEPTEEELQDALDKCVQFLAVVDKTISDLEEKVFS